MQRKNTIRSGCRGRKREVQRLAKQSPADQIIIAPIGNGTNICGEGVEAGDMALLKLNFTPEDLTPGRLVIFRHRQVPGFLMMKLHQAANNQCLYPDKTTRGKHFMRAPAEELGLDGEEADSGRVKDASEERTD